MGAFHVEHSDADRAPSASELADRLEAPLRSLGLALSGAQSGLLARYLALLLPWNARVNLTGARTAHAILERHLADGFVLAAHLPERCRTLLDVGAGAGFASVACAVLRPELRCTLLEPNGKKHTFLRAVARELPLPGVRALRERLEEHVGSAGFERYDAAVSVATWEPAEWLRRAEAVVAPGGVTFAFATKANAAGILDAQRVVYRVGSREGILLARGS
jgi:16S rRNA (guanine527-N7)-methyltransferase